jgi:hypothetical protein
MVYSSCTDDSKLKRKGTVSLNHLGREPGILCTEKRAPKHLVKRLPVPSCHRWYIATVCKNDDLMFSRSPTPVEKVTVLRVNHIRDCFTASS